MVIASDIALKSGVGDGGDGAVEKGQDRPSVLLPLGPVVLEVAVCENYVTVLSPA